MSSSDNLRIAAAWMEMHRHKTGSPAYKENFWAFERISDLCQSEPETAWAVILQIHDLAKDDEHALANLAAGPMEDLLAKHGARLIDRIEEKSHEDQSFSQVVGMVWRNNIQPEIWTRLQRLANR